MAPRMTLAQASLLLLFASSASRLGQALRPLEQNPLLSGQNLLINGDAEKGKSADGLGTPGDVIPNWIVSEKGMLQVKYGFPAGTLLYPDKAASSAINGGNAFFVAGQASRSSLYQDVDVTKAAAEIDRPHIIATLSAYLGGWMEQEDYATVTAEFLDQSKKPIKSFQIGPVTAKDRDFKTTFLLQVASRVVPARTRTIRVWLRSVRVADSWGDGYADKLDLSLVKK